MEAVMSTRVLEYISTIFRLLWSPSRDHKNMKRCMRMTILTIDQHDRVFAVGREEREMSLVCFYHPVSINVSLLGTSRLWLLGVCFPVEVCKEEEEHGPVEKDDIAEDLGEVALDEKGEGSVDEEGHKLAQLHSSKVPGSKRQWFLKLWHNPFCVMQWRRSGSNRWRYESGFKADPPFASFPQFMNLKNCRAGL